LRLRIAPAEDVQSPLRREPVEPVVRALASRSRNCCRSSRNTRLSRPLR
jgi:hypothetical protein